MSKFLIIITFRMGSIDLQNLRGNSLVNVICVILAIAKYLHVILCPSHLVQKSITLSSLHECNTSS